MMRKLCGAALVLLCCVGLGLADEIRAVITKVDGNNVTFAEAKKGGAKGDAKTLPVADNVKVLKGVYDKDTKTVKAGDPIEGGLKSDTFTKIDAEKGVRATIVTDADNKKITEIRVGGRRGKGKE